MCSIRGLFLFIVISFVLVTAPIDSFAQEGPGIAAMVGDCPGGVGNCVFINTEEQFNEKFSEQNKALLGAIDERFESRNALIREAVNGALSRGAIEYAFPWWEIIACIFGTAVLTALLSVVLVWSFLGPKNGHVQLNRRDLDSIVNTAVEKANAENKILINGIFERNRQGLIDQMVEALKPNQSKPRKPGGGGSSGGGKTTRGKKVTATTKEKETKTVEESPPNNGKDKKAESSSGGTGADGSGSGIQPSFKASPQNGNLATGDALGGVDGVRPTVLSGDAEKDCKVLTPRSVKGAQIKGALPPAKASLRHS